MASKKEIELVIRAMRKARRQPISASDIAHIMWDQGWKRRVWSDGPNPGAVSNVTRNEKKYFKSVRNPTGRQGNWFRLTEFGRTVKLPLSGSKTKGTDTKTERKPRGSRATPPPLHTGYPPGGKVWHDKERQLTGRLFVSNVPEHWTKAPTRGGIYFLHDKKGNVIYVGESESYADTHGIRGRITFHHNPSTPHEDQYVDFAFFSYLEVPRTMILSLEEFLIRVFKPKNNRNFIKANP